MDPDLVRFHFVIGSLGGEMVRGRWLNDPEKMETEIAAIGGNLKNFSAIYRDLSDAELEHRLHGWTYAMVNGMLQKKDLTTPSRIIHEYESTVRDAHLFGPKIQQWTQELPGVKTVMVGIAHVPAIEGVLRGKTVPAPPPWPEYVQGLTPEKQRALEDFSGMAYYPRKQITDETNSGPSTPKKVIEFSSKSPADRGVVVRIDKKGPRKGFFK